MKVKEISEIDDVCNFIKSNKERFLKGFIRFTDKFGDNWKCPNGNLERYVLLMHQQNGVDPVGMSFHSTKDFLMKKHILLFPKVYFTL